MNAPAPAPAAAARKVHVLKSVQKAFAATWTGDKRHEIRRFDRSYVVGDVVLLLEFLPVTRPTGAAAGPLGWWGPRLILGRITHLTGPNAFGLPPSLCVFTLGDVVCLSAGEPHDDTRPPVPAPAARGSLPADVLDAWTSYNPRELRAVPAPPAPPPAPAAASRPARRPARKKPARKKGARRR